MTGAIASLHVRLLAAVACGVAVALLPGPPVAHGAARPLDIRATVRLVPGGGATLLQRGSFAGAPLGRGTLSLRTRIGEGDGATFSFVMAGAGGRLHGSGNVRLTFRGSTVIYRGHASIAAGSGAYRGMRASGLRVSGRGPLTGETFDVRLTGRVST